MKIEVWSDFVCPYCFLGKRHLELALEKFAHKNKVIVKFKSYQLNDPKEKHEEVFVQDVLAKKYRRPKEEIEMMNNQLKEQAKEVGLSFNFEKLLHIHTFDVHRLVKYAESIHLDEPFITYLFEAYFTDNENINDQSTLLAIAKKAGMDEEKTIEIMETCKYTQAVNEDIEIAKDMNVQGVPFFVINEKYALTGAQPVDAFLGVLEKIWGEEGSVFSQTTKGTNFCCGDECE